MARDRFLFGPYASGYDPEFVGPEMPPAVARAEAERLQAPRHRRAARSAAEYTISPGEIIRETAPALAYGAGLLTGDEDRAARWDAAARDALDNPVTEAVTDLPGMDVEYSPAAVALNAVPFSDEVLGLATSLDTGRPYREAQGTWEGLRNRVTQENPGSAIVGSLAQGAITAPLALGQPLRVASGASRAAAIANRAAPLALAGAGAGGLAGYAAAEPGSELEGAVRGALTGGAVGGTAGLLGAAGGQLRAAPGVARSIAASGLEGGGYGLLSGADYARSGVEDPGAMALELGAAGATGAGVGAGIGTLGAIGSAGMRAMRDVAAARGRMTGIGGSADDVAASQLDESVLDFPELADDIDQFQGTGADFVDPAEVARQRMEARERGGIVDAALQSALEGDAATDRLHSLGLQNRAQIRSAERGFGGTRQFLAAAREQGLAPEAGIYTTQNQIEQARHLRDVAGPQLGEFYRRAQGATIPGSTIADDIQREADRYRAIVGNPAARARAERLDRIAEDYRFSGYEPSREVAFPIVETLPGIDGDIAVPGVLPATMERQGIPRTLSFGEVQAAREQMANDLRNVFSGGVVNQSSDQLADRAVYSALARARDRAVEQSIPQEAIPLYHRTNRAFRVGTAVAGRPNETNLQAPNTPGAFRSALGAMAGATTGSNPVAALGGAVTGGILTRGWTQYQPSVMATIREVGIPSMPDAITAAARAVVQSAARGGSAVRIPPDAAARIAEAAARPPGSQQAIDQTIDALRTVLSAAERAPEPVRREIGRAVGRVDAINRWPAWVRTVERISRTSPERLGAYADAITQAADRGTLEALLIAASRSHPEFNDIMEGAVQEAQSQAAALESEDEARLFGAEQEAPPDLSDMEDEDLARIIGR